MRTRSLVLYARPSLVEGRWWSFGFWTGTVASKTSDSDGETSTTTGNPTSSSSSDASGAETTMDSQGESIGTGTNDDVDLRCLELDPEWKTANERHRVSHPDPDCLECVEFNGCPWDGSFAVCSAKRRESWAAENEIVRFFPNFGTMVHHDLCIRSGDRVMVVNVVDFRVDADCNDYCSKALDGREALIEMESYTNARWGRSDGGIEWADLGPRAERLCD